MSMFTQTQRAEVVNLAGVGCAKLLAGFDWLASMLVDGLRSLSEERIGAMRQNDERGAPSELFVRSISANYRHEVDWICAAAQLKRPSEQRYCLLRALDINPGSDLARSMLSRVR